MVRLVASLASARTDTTVKPLLIRTLETSYASSAVLPLSKNKFYNTCSYKFRCCHGITNGYLKEIARPIAVYCDLCDLCDMDIILDTDTVGSRVNNNPS